MDRKKAEMRTQSAIRGERTAKWMLHVGLCAILMLLFGCRASNDQQSAAQEITVAAAANLTDAFTEVSNQFTAKTGVRVVCSFASTADLTKQIENGGPFDVFASADVEHIDALDKEGLVIPGSKAVYALGQLVLWIPSQSQANINSIGDIVNSNIKTIAIAKPDLAPYGRASVEALEALNIWLQVEPKVVYGSNVSTAKQYAQSGNADAAFIPMALVKPGEGNYVKVDVRLHRPIEQALAIVKASAKQDAAKRFTDFVLSADGQAILQTFGYAKP
jgi:molybdate transport system substrate-binding protein